MHTIIARISLSLFSFAPVVEATCTLPAFEACAIHSSANASLRRRQQALIVATTYTPSFISWMHSAIQLHLDKHRIPLQLSYWPSVCPLPVLFWRRTALRSFTQQLADVFGQYQQSVSQVFVVGMHMYICGSPLCLVCFFLRGNGST